MTPDDIRKIVLKSLFSTDKLVDILTLKGGNALKLLGITERQSQDLDFSIKKDIRFNETEDSYLFQNALNKGFEEEGYVVNNYKFKNKPQKRRENLPDFWGGYEITFSIISRDQVEKLEQRNISNINAYAESLENDSKVIQIDLSFDEYTESRVSTDIDNVTIYLYSPLMIVYEKIRASCQQLDEYQLASSKTRARDLYDIYSTLTNIKYVDLREEILNPNNFEILKKMFELKEVSIDLIPKIKTIKDRLEKNYLDVVVPQIPSEGRVVGFDYLFEYCTTLFDELYLSLKKSL